MTKLALGFHSHVYRLELKVSEAKQMFAPRIALKTTKAEIKITEACSQKDAAMKQIKHKKVPWYHEWLEIFGKDRADGGVSENLHQAYHSVFGIKPTKGTPQESDSQSSSKNLLTEEAQSVTQTVNEKTEAPKKSCKKRKSSNFDDMDMKFMGSIKDIMDDQTQKSLSMFAEMSGNKKDGSAARNQVYEALGKIENLNMVDHLAIGLRIVRDPALLDYFFSLPKDARAVLVKTTNWRHF